MRGAQLVIAALACMMAISVTSIYYLFLLCSDFVYVILFPQLLCVLYIRWSNAYGSFAGYVIGLLMRLLGGEPGLNLQPTISQCFCCCCCWFCLFYFVVGVVVCPFICLY